MKPKVDQELCIGCGSCAALCPKCFRLNMEIGKAEVLEEASCEMPCCNDARENCPVAAISCSEE